MNSRANYIFWKLRTYTQYLLQFPLAFRRKIRVRSKGSLPRVRSGKINDQHFLILNSLYRQPTFIESSVGNTPDHFLAREEGVEYLFSGVKPMLLLKKRIHGSEDMIENEFAHNLTVTLREVGLKPELFWLDSTGESKSHESANQVQSLEAKLKQIGPTHLVIDSNQSTQDSLLNESSLLDLKCRYGIKVIVIMLDFSTTKLEYWCRRLADVLVYCRPDQESKIRSVTKARLLCWPGSPYPSISNLEAKREIDFFYSGSASRNRKDFLTSLIDADMKCKINFGNRVRAQSYSYDDYMKTLLKSKITFSNGFVRRGEDLITGRALEAFSTQTLLIYEESKTMSYFFSPYSHYIPVKTGNELLAHSLYLLKNEELRKEIAESAHLFYKRNYSNLAFWSGVFN